MSKVVKAEIQIENAMKENCACYVLITCSEPDSKGKMDVEMKYDGDEALAAFLVENARQVFDDRFQCRKSK